MKKTKIVLGTALATVTMAAIMVSPQALAKKESDRHHADRMAQMDANKEKVLEAQLQAMQDEIISLRAAVDAATASKKVDANSQKVQELDAWMADVKSKPAEKKSKDNMLYFRGGYSGNDQSMVATTNQINGSAGTITTGQQGGTGGWNFGAGTPGALTDKGKEYTENVSSLMAKPGEYAGKGAEALGLDPIVGQLPVDVAMNFLPLGAPVVAARGLVNRVSAKPKVEPPVNKTTEALDSLKPKTEPKDLFEQKPQTLADNTELLPSNA
ncbi:MAG: hypothetical protein ACO294_11350, partial [Methylococcales bacterium]